jgi:crotonobetainyl-CoA:carnitine CoA-transferase CaiB-like acyl-CoA transferase
MAGPLAGVKIVDCTSVVLGPWATQQLGDFGADIIKVEPPEGDVTRQLGPKRNPDMAAFYMGCNRNKRSIVLDLKKPDGKKALFRLAETADVLMHNYRPEPAARLGISYEAVANVNPGILYLATYGYRAAGPMGAQAAYDDIIQAGSGLAMLQTVVAGSPRFLPTIVADKTSSNGVVSAVLAGLFERERSGKGQAIEVPMYETLVSFVMVEHLYGETFVPKIEGAGYRRLLNKERRPYPSKDGYFALLPYNDGHWQEFCKLIGREDILADPRFKGLANRLANIETVYATLAEVCATRTNAEWTALLADSNVPHGPVQSLEDLLTDPQLESTGYWQEVDHPTEGRIRMPGIAPSFSRTPPEIRRLQPNLGEHSVEILGEAGFKKAEIDAMLKSGATRDGRQRAAARGDSGPRRDPT